MLTKTLDPNTIDQLQPLLEETFFARDQLYSAARQLRDEDQRKLCGWFADRLGGYAATFQQMVLAGGQEPAEPQCSHTAQAKISEVQTEFGTEGVLHVAKQTEERLAARYQETMHYVEDGDTAGLLAQHQRELEIIDCVLRMLTRSD